MGVSVELEQDFAAAGVGVEVDEGGRAEKERGPQIRRICGKIWTRKCDLRKRNRDINLVKRKSMSVIFVATFFYRTAARA